MNKLPFYIAVGVAGAAVAALIISIIHKDQAPTITSTTQSHGKDYLLDSTSSVNKTFASIDYNKLLNRDTQQGETEITLLQHMINAWYGSPTPSVTTSGVYDTATRNAVLDITGKAETSVYEFFYLYLSPKRGQAEGERIIATLFT